MHNVAGEGLFLFIYTTKYFNDPLLQYECLLDNAVFF